MLQQPYRCGQFATENRTKFNKGINEIAVLEKNTRVMEIKSLEMRHFNGFGDLNMSGKLQLWREINDQIEAFEAGRNNMNPKYYMANPIPMRNIPSMLNEHCRSSNGDSSGLYNHHRHHQSTHYD